MKRDKEGGSCRFSEPVIHFIWIPFGFSVIFCLTLLQNPVLLVVPSLKGRKRRRSREGLAYDLLDR